MGKREEVDEGLEVYMEEESEDISNHLVTGRLGGHFSTPKSSQSLSIHATASAYNNVVDTLYWWVCYDTMTLKSMILCP